MSRKLIVACTLGLGLITLIAVADARRPAQAWTSPYAWCALFGATESQSTSCHYFTFEQCQAAVWGVGGHCYPNPTYAGPPEEPVAPPRKYRRRNY
jgi:hypothetical protein